MSSAPRALVRHQADTSLLELEPPLGQELKAGSALAAHFHGPEGLLLVRERPGVTGTLAGSLSCLTLGELFGHLVGGLRTGRLYVQEGQVRRAVVLRDGQVVFASSSARHERLGACLVRLGLVTEAQLKAALAGLKPGVRVGQALVGAGLLSAAQLYSAMTFLVRDIVVSLFEVEAGHFLFLEGGPPAEDALKLPERTRDLVLAGMKRAEELSRLRRRLPASLRLAAGPTPPPPEEQAQVARVVEGTLGEAQARHEGSPSAFLGWVDAALRAGVLVERQEVAAAARTGVPAGEPASAPERFAAFVREACALLREAGGTLEPLRAFLATPQEGLEEAFAGVTLGEEGTLDVERVQANVRSADPALARALALEALDAFAAYALFAVKNALPAEKAALLDARFRALHAEET